MDFVEQTYADIDDEDKIDWEFENYGIDEDKEEIMVAGGGMMNGNAYATVSYADTDGVIRYREYGKNAKTECYRHHYLHWNDSGSLFCIRDLNRDYDV